MSERLQQSKAAATELVSWLAASQGKGDGAAARVSGALPPRALHSELGNHVPRDSS